MKQDVPARSCGLAKNDVCDAFALGKVDKPIRRPLRLHFDYGRSHLYGQLNVFGELPRIFRSDSGGMLPEASAHRQHTRVPPYVRRRVRPPAAVAWLFGLKTCRP